MRRPGRGDGGAMTMPRKLESAVEAAIRQARERGDFDGLPVAVITRPHTLRRS